MFYICIKFSKLDLDNFLNLKNFMIPRLKNKQKYVNHFFIISLATLRAENLMCVFKVHAHAKYTNSHIQTTGESFNRPRQKICKIYCYHKTLITSSIRTLFVPKVVQTGTL